MAEQKRKEWVCVVIKEEQKNWRGWELHQVCAGLIEEEGEQEWSFRSHGLSFSVFFPLYFPCSAIISQIFCPWDSSCTVSTGKIQAFVFFHRCALLFSVLKNSGSCLDLVGTQTNLKQLFLTPVDSMWDCKEKNHYLLGNYWERIQINLIVHTPSLTTPK